MLGVSDNKKPLLIALLSLIAVCVSGYLTYEHILVYYSYTEGQSFCAISETFNCATAAQSDFSKFLGIPISLWGLGLYFIMMIWAYKLYSNPEKYQHLTLIGFVLFLGSVVYSVSLGIISAVVLKAYCPFCISLYFLNICLFLVFWSMSKGRLSLQNIIDSISHQLAQKSTLIYLLIYAGILLGGLKYKHYWSMNNSNSVYFYDQHHKEKIELKGSDYLQFGNKNAKIRIDIFSDYQCPYCEKAHQKISQLLKEHSSKVLVYMRNFLLILPATHI